MARGRRVVSGWEAACAERAQGEERMQARRMCTAETRRGSDTEDWHAFRFFWTNLRRTPTSTLLRGGNSTFSALETDFFGVEEEEEEVAVHFLGVELAGEGDGKGALVERWYTRADSCD